MTMRKQVCYKAWSKAETAKEIVATSPTSKWIIFTMFIDLATKLCEQIPSSKVYHSKQKDEDRVSILESYEKNEFNILIAVKALDAGMNIPDIDKAISISGTSPELTARQRLGRIARKKDAPSTFINLFSKNTVDKDWLEKRNKGLDGVEWITLNSLKTKLRNGNRSR